MAMMEFGKRGKGLDCKQVGCDGWCNNQPPKASTHQPYSHQQKSKSKVKPTQSTHQSKDLENLITSRYELFN